MMLIGWSVTNMNSTWKVTTPEPKWDEGRKNFSFSVSSSVGQTLRPLEGSVPSHSISHGTSLSRYQPRLLAMTSGRQW
jgi:hypothetical protein